jgi:hypothetical protein
MRSHHQVRELVLAWTFAHHHDDWAYGSPQSYWSKAMAAGICNQEEYEEAKKRNGSLWNYRGD